MSGDLAVKQAPQIRDLSSFYGWRILAVFWALLAVNVGFTTYGASIMNTAMAEAMGFSGGSLGLSYSAFMLMLGLPAPIVAYAINRFGLRLPILVGTILIASGTLIMSTLVVGPVSAAATFGLLVGTGVATGGNIVTQVGIGFWFVRRRAMALSIMFSANGIGGLIAAPLLNGVIDFTGNWRSGWVIITILTTLVGALALLIVRDKPADVGQVPDGGVRAGDVAPARVHITQSDFAVRDALRTRSFWLLALVTVANFGALSLVLSLGVANLRNLGHSPAEAAVAVSILSGGTLLGKLLLGFPGDRVEPRLLWMLSTGLIAIGLATAPFAESTFGLVIYAGLFGMGFGGALVMQTATMLNYFGLKPFASLLSFALLAQTLVSAAVPLAAGLLYDKFGEYTAAFLTGSMLSVAAVAVLQFATPPGPVPEHVVKLPSDT